MQQFSFLPLATYVAQMVFAKTFRDQNTSAAIRLWELLEKEVKLSSKRPPSGSLLLPALSHTWSSGLCQTLPPSPSSEKMIAPNYENICVSGNRRERNGWNSSCFETARWAKLHRGKVRTKVWSSEESGDTSHPVGDLSEVTGGSALLPGKTFRN